MGSSPYRTHHPIRWTGQEARAPRRSSVVPSVDSLTSTGGLPAHNGDNLGGRIYPDPEERTLIRPAVEAGIPESRVWQ